MGLDKSIEHGHDHRKQYYGDKAIDKSCRNHGSDPYALSNRTYKHKKREERMHQMTIEDWLRDATLDKEEEE